MKTYKILIVAITLLFQFSFTGKSDFSNLEWKLKKTEEGIKIYVRDKPGNLVKELKIVTSFNTRLSVPISLLSDKASMNKWVYGCQSSHILKKVSEKEIYHYQETEAPWPVQNRDAIIHSKLKQDLATKVVEIETKALPDYIERKEGKVRLENYHAHWTFTPKANGIVDVEYNLSIDPGGNVPTWVINMALTDGPLNTIKNMKGMLKEPKYYGAKLSYIVD